MPFNDGQHIIYVNGEYDKDNTPLAQLVRDMKQHDYRKIQNQHMAEQMRLCKKGRYLDEMCIELVQERNIERKNGITILIASYLEDGAPESKIVNKLADKYNLSENEAKSMISDVQKSMRT